MGNLIEFQVMSEKDNIRFKVRSYGSYKAARSAIDNSGHADDYYIRIRITSAGWGVIFIFLAMWLWGNNLPL